MMTKKLREKLVKKNKSKKQFKFYKTRGEKMMTKKLREKLVKKNKSKKQFKFYKTKRTNFLEKQCQGFKILQNNVGDLKLKYTKNGKCIEGVISNLSVERSKSDFINLFAKQMIFQLEEVKND